MATGNRDNPLVLPYGATNPLPIVVEGSNIPVGSQVTLESRPALGGVVSGTGTLSGTQDSSSTTIDLSISNAQVSTLTAKVSYDLVAALGEPLWYDGEKVVRVEIASTLGAGASQVLYITKSGRQIPVVM